MVTIMSLKKVKVFATAMLLATLGATSYAQETLALYQQSCATCHAAGVLGAPKSHDVAAWAPRKKQGMDTLVSRVKNGYKNMPARGLCDACTDQDLVALINYMSSADVSNK